MTLRMLPRLGLPSFVLVAITAASTPGCGDSGSEGDGSQTEESACLPEAADATCSAALYGTDPTFSDVYATTLEPKCALSGCHGGDNPQRGLSFAGEDAAYDALFGSAESGAAIVVPGDTQCGELIYRLEIGGPEGMPPGSQLSEEERCSIRHFIDNGAPR